MEYDRLLRFLTSKSTKTENARTNTHTHSLRRKRERKKTKMSNTSENRVLSDADVHYMCLRDWVFRNLSRHNEVPSHLSKVYLLARVRVVRAHRPLYSRNKNRGKELWNEGKTKIKNSVWNIFIALYVIFFIVPKQRTTLLEQFVKAFVELGYITCTLLRKFTNTLNTMLELDFGRNNKIKTKKNKSINLGRTQW